MNPQDDLPSLKALEEDIRRFQSKAAPKAGPRAQGGSPVIRMGTEFASGVLVGAGVGLLLDRWLGTSPVLCILCFFLGAGAGFRSLYRTSQAMDRQGEAQAETTDDKPTTNPDAKRQ